MSMLLRHSLLDVAIPPEPVDAGNPVLIAIIAVLIVALAAGAVLLILRLRKTKGAKPSGKRDLR